MPERALILLRLPCGLSTISRGSSELPAGPRRAPIILAESATPGVARWWDIGNGSFAGHYTESPGFYDAQESTVRKVKFIPTWNEATTTAASWNTVLQSRVVSVEP